MALRANGIDALGDGSWINRISTYNGNLLRELLILQAQMLQMQYAIYADQQKDSSYKQQILQMHFRSVWPSAMSSSLKGSIYDYLSGVQGISGMTPAESTAPSPSSMPSPSSSPASAIMPGAGGPPTRPQ